MQRCMMLFLILFIRILEYNGKLGTATKTIIQNLCIRIKVQRFVRQFVLMFSVRYDSWLA